jgi:hypothetical protein
MTRGLARSLPLAGLALSLAAGPPTRAQHGADSTACGQPTLECAAFATPQFDGSGRLWVAWSGARHVAMASSPDLGRTFGPAVLVNRSPLGIDTGADARPQLVFDRTGAAIVAFTVRRDDQFNGQVLVARSNAARTGFGSPMPVSEHPASQRFVTLSADPTGRVFAAWIDKRREGIAATLPESDGASVAYAWSDDGGATFSAASLAHAGMCECCRLGTALTPDGRPVIAFRDVHGGVRDHAVLTFSSPGSPGPAVPLPADRWEIAGCPHQGPSLAIGSDGTYHVAWFTDGRARQGTFYAQSRDGGRLWSAPMALSATGRAQRPYLAAVGADVWLVWKEQSGSTSTVFARRSPDGGRSWSGGREVATASGTSDHPLLVTHEDRVYLSWLTRSQGYRLIALAPSF